MSAIRHLDVTMMIRILSVYALGFLSSL